MTIKKRILRRPGKGSATTLSPTTLVTLSLDGNLETVVRLEVTVGGDPLFAGLTDDDSGIAAGIEILHRLWPQHGVAATKRCIKTYGPGNRPALWWIHEAKERPPVPERNWNDPDDAERFARERAAADLEYLRAHNHLTKDELRLLAEKAKGDRHDANS